MTVQDVVKILNGKEINLPDKDREVTCGYAGDFLSHVMGSAPSNCAWFTIMNNVNVCAVATLADVALIVLCESVMPDDNLKTRVESQGINIISTSYDIYTAAVSFDRELNK